MQGGDGWDNIAQSVRPLQGLIATHPCGSVRPMSVEPTLRIIIIDVSPVRVAILKEGLCAVGHVDLCPSTISLVEGSRT